MGLVPVTFDDFSGGLADLYIGTDITRAAVLSNLLIDETKKPYVRYGTSIFQTQIPVTANAKPSGLYIGPEPFSHPVVMNGPYAYVMNESAGWTSITGPNTTFLPTKLNDQESALIWRRQLICACPITSMPPQMIYATNYVAPSTPANPAAYSALTLGLPALATAPSTNMYLFTISGITTAPTTGATYTNNGKTFTVLTTVVGSKTQMYCSGTGTPAASGNLVKTGGTGDDPVAFSAFTAQTSLPSGTAAYNAVYAFFYKYTFIDYTGTLFAFFGNPNLPSFVNGASVGDPGTTGQNISLTGLVALANTSLTNYDVSNTATTNTTYTAGSTTATVSSATGLAKGQQLINANVTQGTVITGISGTTLTLSLPAVTTASASSTVFSALTVQIYRTINGGTVLFYDGMVANGTTTFTDNVSDATLQVQQPIYTSGGALGYDQPPQNVLAVTQTNDFFWYATSTTLYQSIQGSPGSCPSSFSNQIDQKIISLSDVVSFPILFCDHSVYRVEGTFDSFGNGGFALREISKVAGCISKSSIVKTPHGIVWFGNGGIYATDGYNVTKLTKHLNFSYALWNNSSVKGEYDPSRNMVYWTISTSGNALNNAWLVLHLAYGLTEESVFSTLVSENNLYPTTLKLSQSADISNTEVSVSTTGTWVIGLLITVASATGIQVGQSVSGVGISYGTTVTAVIGTAVYINTTTTAVGNSATVTFTQTIYSQLYSRMLFTDLNNYLLWFDPNSLTDVKINTNLYPSQMLKQAILYDFTTAGLDQGVKGFRKYTSDVVLEVDAATPVAVQIQHRRDDGGGGWSGQGGSPATGKGVAGSPGGGSTGNPGVPEIRQEGALSWAINDCVWDTDANEHLWNDFATVSGKRSVPATQLRSARRQLKFTNSFTIIDNSDSLSTATVLKSSGTGVANTVTLDPVIAYYYANLNGSNGRIQYVNAINSDWNIPFSLSGWVNLDAIVNSSWTWVNGVSRFTMTILPAGSNLNGISGTCSLKANNSNYIEFSYNANVTSSSLWNHLLLTYDGSGLVSGLKLYVNGFLQTQTSTTDNLASTAFTTKIHSPQIDGGKWDDFAIYSASLTSTQVSEIFSAGQSADLRTLSSSSSLTHAYPLLTNSLDTVGSINGSENNVSYGTGNNPSIIWPSDLEDYYFCVASDSYNQTYKIVSRASDSVINILDPYATLANGSTKWEIKGFRKFERPRILNFVLNAEVDGPTYGQATAPVGANT